MRRIIQKGWSRGDDPAALLTREWIVTNGLGGYASGTIGGLATRRYHGKLIAALPPPLGRTVMLNYVEEEFTFPDGSCIRLNSDERGGAELRMPEIDFLESFVLEHGFPVWTYRRNGFVFEKRVAMPNGQNSVHAYYRLVEGDAPIRLALRPFVHLRPHEGEVSEPLRNDLLVSVDGAATELTSPGDFPPLRLVLHGSNAALIQEPREHDHLIYRMERSRGYRYEGGLWSPGYYEAELAPGASVTLIGSTEEWGAIRALTPDEVFELEYRREDGLLERARATDAPEEIAQLILAADQFVITPLMRPGDTARARATGDEPRTVIAGYHWFTDWGRDTMISLEGLTLCTGRYREAASILRTFASYVRDGLIPNMFPEGEHEGLYHTADATLWFFHAVDRYLHYTGDRAMIRQLLPLFADIIEHHVRGTRFGIGVDPSDGLLREGAEGYQLTWMDAKVDGWVVTPRRGKPVEINALFYNALRTVESWARDENDAAIVSRVAPLADRVYESFNSRFWCEERGHLYDVVDDEGGGNDAALRPNQIFSISLRHPVLDRSRWEAVMQSVEKTLLTPVGLRSLAPGHPDYKPKYDGDLRARDAAYHQGTVWGWLIGPYIDAFLKLHPERVEEARRRLAGLIDHLGEAGIGTISEVFDAEAPYTPRGCIAQAWSVAEVLRCLHLTSGAAAGKQSA